MADDTLYTLADIKDYFRGCRDNATGSARKRFEKYIEAVESAMNSAMENRMTDKERHDLEAIAKVRGGGTLKVVCADYVLWNHGYYCREMGKRVAVVRCENCAYWQAPSKEEAEDGCTIGKCANRYGTCERQDTDATWYCADGERVEE